MDQPNGDADRPRRPADRARFSAPSRPARRCASAWRAAAAPASSTATTSCSEAPAADDVVLARDGATVLIDSVSLAIYGRLGDRLRRRPDRPVLPDQEPARRRLLRLRHELLDLTAPAPMRIATWNINGVKARIDNLLHWLREASPDVVCLQEIKTRRRGVSRAGRSRTLGYNVAVHGQKGFHGVALLSKHPLEDVQRGLPTGDGDAQSRFIPALIIDRRTARSASPRPTCRTAIRSGPRNSPTSSPG